MRYRTVKWILCLVCLLLFVLIGLNFSAMAGADSAVYGVVHGWMSPAATFLALAFTNLAGPVGLLTLTLLGAALVPQKRYRIPLLMNLSVEVLLNLGLKNLFNRPRPTEALRLAVETGSSFPSGHTMAAACFYGFLIYLVWRMVARKGLRRLLTAVLTMVILAVGLSRIYLGVHYFSDVLGGLLISGCYLIVFTAFVDLFFSGEKPGRLLVGRTADNRALSSFVYAIEGIAAGVRSERNMVAHFAVVAVVVVFGALLSISATEWLICTVLCGCVLTAEMFNTALETVVDMICPQVDPRAKLAKDVSAGAVLFMSISAAVAGCVIFLPKLWTLVLG